MREHGAVMDSILSNMQTGLRRMLDALAEAERARPRGTDEQ
jgi:hypothetical protein